MKEIFSSKVKKDWVDYNRHMNDSAYAKVFSTAVDHWMNQIGITKEFRENEKYTVFTLETHLVYLDEANEGEDLTIKLQLLDYDEKRAHVFFVMNNLNDERIATSEQMLMGMDTDTGRPAPFPESIMKNIEKIANDQKDLGQPKEAGRTIGIRRK